MKNKKGLIIQHLYNADEIEDANTETLCRVIHMHDKYYLCRDGEEDVQLTDNDFENAKVTSETITIAGGN